MTDTPEEENQALDIRGEEARLLWEECFGRPLVAAVERLVKEREALMAVYRDGSSDGFRYPDTSPSDAPLPCDERNDLVEDGRHCQCWRETDGGTLAHPPCCFCGVEEEYGDEDRCTENQEIGDR